MSQSPLHSVKRWAFPLFVAVGFAGLFSLNAVHGGDVASPDWETSIEEAKKKAAAENKLILMDIYADWCSPCKMMDRSTYSNEKVLAKLEHYIPLKINADEEERVAYEYGTGSLPTTQVLTAEGTPLATSIGYLDDKMMIELLEAVEEPFERIKKLEKEFAAGRDNLETTLSLAAEYLVVQNGSKALARLEDWAELIAGEDSVDLQARYYYHHAAAQLMLEEYEKGLGELESFRRQFKGHALTGRVDDLYVTGSLFLALAKMDGGDVERARPLFERVVEKAKDRELAAYAGEQLKKIESL